MSFIIFRKYAISIAIAVMFFTTFFSCTATQTDKPDTTVISDAVLTTAVGDDAKPTAPAQTRFGSDVPAIYCSFKLSDVSKEAMIKASWLYIKGEAANMENMVINETYSIASQESGNYYIALYLDKPAGGWPKGQYKLVLAINNVEKVAIPFNIE